MSIPLLFLIGFVGLSVWVVTLNKRMLRDLPEGPRKEQLRRTLSRGE